MAEWDHRWILGGGVGSGKTEVRRLFDSAGIATIDSDAIGHGVLARGGAAHAEVAAAWPETVRGGDVDRSALGEIVFRDIGELRRLEAITHPHIFGMIAAAVEKIAGLVVVELPVVSRPLEGVWRTIVVDADDDLRFQRALARGMREDVVRDVMAAQPSRAEWLARADLVIPNHDDLAALEETVRRAVPFL